MTEGSDVRRRLASRTTTAQRLVASSQEVLSMGSAANISMPHPLLVDHARGSRVWDVDGNEYIDTMLGYGALVLGHRHPAVEAAMAAQLEHGWHFGIHNPLQEELARLMMASVRGIERVIFCNSGSEATFYAMRAARAFSGRDKVAFFDGFYHGAHDYGMVHVHPGSPHDAPESVLTGAGVPQAIRGLTTLLPHGSDAALEHIRTHGHELALVMIEPVQSSNPRITDESVAFLHDVQSACKEAGVLFLLDEVITGFRLSAGGAQERFDLDPDLTTFGKVIGGGTPVGAVGGRADVMELFQGIPRGDTRGIFSGGSFSGNPLTMAAGRATLRALAEDPGVFGRMDARATRIAEGVNQHAADRGMPVQVLVGGSSFQIFFQAGEIRSSRDLALGKHPAEQDFYLHLLDRGVLVPGNKRSTLSAAHDDADTATIIDAMTVALDLCRTDGIL